MQKMRKRGYSSVLVQLSLGCRYCTPTGSFNRSAWTWSAPDPMFSHNRRLTDSEVDFVSSVCASDSEDSTSEDDQTDSGRPGSRGRPSTQRQIGPQAKDSRSNGTFLARQASVHSASSHSRRSSPSKLASRRTFTRSRSPAVHPPQDNSVNGLNRPSSPSLFSRHRHVPVVAIRSLFPSTVCIPFCVPFARGVFKATFDTRQALENILLLCSVGAGIACCVFDNLLHMDKGLVDKDTA
ncbi:hypothetical protein C8Q79DRAFT_507557 [Trametes meyenii]|nr:hypothetical protein C8Q79DRAFT_507557 [Trametes meyenii]